MQLAPEESFGAHLLSLGEGSGAVEVFGEDERLEGALLNKLLYKEVFGKWLSCFVAFVHQLQHLRVETHEGVAQQPQTAGAVAGHSEDGLQLDPESPQLAGRHSGVACLLLQDGPDLLRTHLLLQQKLLLVDGVLVRSEAGGLREGEEFQEEG